MDNDDEQNTDASPDRDGFRPLGRLLRTVDHLVSRAFAEALADEGIDRRDWMLLNALGGTHGDHADRVAPVMQHKGRGKRMRALAEHGWVVRDADGAWTLTDSGRAERDRLGGVVDGIRSRIAGAVTPEQYETMVAALEAIADELGGQQSAPWTWPGGPGIRRGFGPNRHHGFGHGHGHGFAPGHGRHEAHRHDGRRAERAFERGFDAGFRRGRSV